MYKTFKLGLSISELARLEDKKISKIILESKTIYKNEYFKKIHEYGIGLNVSIDMIKKMEDLFPVDTYDIFISHSHDDLEFARKIKKYLQEEHHLSVFIDSDIWGSSNQFLKEIDNKFCRNDNGTYDYDYRNYSTTHVHMILASSILKIMDKSECVLLLDSGNYSKKGDTSIEVLNSAWLYYEYLLTKHIESRTPNRMKKIIQDSAMGFRHSIPFVANYAINFETMPKINYEALEVLKRTGLKKHDFLDKLYNRGEQISGK